MLRVTLKRDFDGVRIREAPGDGKPVAQAHAGDVLDSLESDSVTRRKVIPDGEWLHVKKSDGITGYIAAWLVEIVEEDAGDGSPEIESIPLDEREVPFIPATAIEVDGEVRILVNPTVNGLRLRDAPVSGATIGNLNKTNVLISLEAPDDTRRKIGIDGEWLKVKQFYGEEGYTAAWMVEAYTGAVPQKPPYMQSLNQTGVNLDVLHPLGAPEAHRLNGLGWVRFGYNVSAAKGSEDIQAAYDRYMPQLEKYAKVGIKVVLVFTHQTFGEGKNEYWPWPTMTTDKWRHLTARFADMVGKIAQQYAGQDLVHAYQVWNEMDAHIGAVASVPMVASDYAIVLGETIKAIKAVDANVPVITGGHTGGPGAGGQYAKKTIAALPGNVRPDGIAFHPYGRGLVNDPYANFGHIDVSMQAYTSILPGKPVWITEWGVLNAANHDPNAILKYASGFVKHLKARYPGKVAAMIWYAWAMSMHNGYGLVDTNRQPIVPLYDGFKNL
jgi:hypothetical protein